MNRKTVDENEKNAFYFLAAFVFVPIFLAFAASWLLPFSIWGTRHLIIIFAPLAILLAKLLCQIKIQSLKLGLISATLAIFGMAFLLQINRAKPQYIWCAWETLAQELPPNEQAEPVKIYLFEDLIAYHLWFALHNSDKNYQIIKINNVEGLSEDQAYFLPRGFDDVLKIDEKEANDKSFWLAFRDNNFNELKPPLITFISKGYKIGTPQIFEAQGLKAFIVKVVNSNNEK